MKIGDGRRFWPGGLTGGVWAVIAIALTLELYGTILLHQWQWRERPSHEQKLDLARRVGAAAGLAEGVRPRDRVAVMRPQSNEAVAFNWVPATVITDASETVPPLMALKHLIVVRGGPATRDRLALTLLPRADGDRDVMGSWRLDDGSFVTFRSGPFLAAAPSLQRTLTLHLLLLGGLLVGVLLALRALTRPLQDLAAQADRVGRGGPVPVAVGGPAEVRRVSDAFAAMQTRLTDMVDDHAQALAAVSHDLRTPIQRMRLRTGQVADPALEQAMEADLVEMEGFITAVLDYVAHDQHEPARTIDVAALLCSIVSDAADAGAAISYHGPDTLVAEARPLMLKRMVGNLIDNARAHADTVQVSAERTHTGFEIRVDDDGPGIPSELRSEAIMPFRRLPGTERPGAGLGLATVVRLANIAGGKLRLDQSDLGGLRATVAIARNENIAVLA